MAKLQVGRGIDDYIATLNELNLNTPRVLKRSIYVGAKIVADEIRRNIQSLPVDDEHTHGTTENPIETITTTQRDGLLDGFGIAKMKDEDGITSTKLGFSKKNQAGQPNYVVAMAVEGGTSFRKRHPFVAPAVRATKKKAEEAMAEELDKEIKNAMKGD